MCKIILMLDNNVEDWEEVIATLLLQSSPKIPQRYASSALTKIGERTLNLIFFYYF